MISVRHLTKNYGEVEALKDVSFEIKRGEIVGLLGHNGAGKTTAMKIITGFLEPTEGTVTIGGIDVLEDRLGVQKQIGYMPESAPSYQEMLVQDYLLLMAELRGVAKSNRIATVIEAARSIGLLNWLTRPIATLSKGYRQRVGLCQAILHRPDVLILDEPTNGLDPLQILEIRELIKKLSKESTVMLSTHILPEIEAVCDRVIILIDGELAKDSPLRELLSTRTITMSVSEEVTSVEEALCTIAGVRSVTRVGKDAERAGYDRFSVTCEREPLPIPEIFRLARQKSWDLGGLSPVVPRLEQVFHGLMIEHAEKSKDSAGGRAAT